MQIWIKGHIFLSFFARQSIFFIHFFYLFITDLAILNFVQSVMAGLRFRVIELLSMRLTLCTPCWPGRGWWSASVWSGAAARRPVPPHPGWRVSHWLEPEPGQDSKCASPTHRQHLCPREPHTPRWCRGTWCSTHHTYNVPAAWGMHGSRSD